MDLNQYTIFIDGVDRTNDILSCEKNSNESYNIVFRNSKKVYPYGKYRIKIKKNNFKDSGILAYLKKIAELNPLQGDTDGKLLAKIYDRIKYIDEISALFAYLNGFCNNKNNVDAEMLIFPFGANNSQIAAVKNAFHYQVSVIEGPPGTGKTQTILNIIANIILRGQTVQVVSNNNSAINNVREKLENNRVEFIAAVLGNLENKKKFIENQLKLYPDYLKEWRYNGDIFELKNKVNKIIDELQKFFDAQVKKAKSETELNELLLEKQYYEKYLNDNRLSIIKLSSVFNISSSKVLMFLDEYQNADIKNKFLYLLFCIKCSLKYGVLKWKFWHQDSKEIIASIQYGFYQTKERELVEYINGLDQFLKSRDCNLLEEMQKSSLIILKDYIWKKYFQKRERVQFIDGNLKSRAQAFLEEYPVVLSTTFSSSTCLDDTVLYDYVIMDEASQVDVATGALALCHAKNAVIVGDSKQLPNVIEKGVKEKAEKIFQQYSVGECYKFTQSFLQSGLRTKSWTIIMR